MSSNLVLHKSIDDTVFTFIDVETTGLSPADSRVCEIAMARFKGDSRIGNFVSLINPEIGIPLEVSKIHGITDDMVKTSPTFEQASSRIIGFIENSVLVAHNAEFDLGFLKMEFERIGLRLPEAVVIDTLIMARRLGRFYNNKLGTIAKELDISSQGWHRALNDVEMTRKIFEHFILILRKDGAVTLGDVLKKFPS
ncbi:MAG: 3'-5' exonuclease [Elusimicrobia bacterium]|nr:3'-5' exonuclease [Elusimicrobiota bacterium]